MYLPRHNPLYIFFQLVSRNVISTVVYRPNSSHLVQCRRKVITFHGTLAPVGAYGLKPEPAAGAVRHMPTIPTSASSRRRPLNLIFGIKFTSRSVQKCPLMTLHSNDTLKNRRWSFGAMAEITLSRTRLESERATYTAR